MLKKIQNDKAESRYWETLEHYRRAMEQNPALTLKAYCQMSYVYHRGLIGERAFQKTLQNAVCMWLNNYISAK